MTEIPLELRETWSVSEQGILNGCAVWSDCREQEPVGILTGFSMEDTNRILLLPKIMAILVATRTAIQQDLTEGTLSTCVQILPELEKMVRQIGVPLPDVDDT